MIDCDGNIIPLRSDIHKVFDERHFCFVPKQQPVYLPTNEQEQNQELGSGLSPRNPQALVLHVFNTTTSGQLQVLYHNRAIHSLLTVVEPEFLLARFAWTIFSPSVSRHFLPQARSPRLLLLYSRDKNEQTTEEVKPERCYQIYLATRSRSLGPHASSCSGGSVASPAPTG